ncbi:MAG: hypothetical protein ACYTF1_11505 [Planctomycetota bacterium]|jgi:hypothetical protein
MQQKLVLVTCLLFMSTPLLIPSSAQADVLSFSLSIEFSHDGVPPGGPTPWLIATFDDQNTPGTVNLTLEATNLLEDEFVFEWLFNLDPALDPTLLVFSETGRIGEFGGPYIDDPDPLLGNEITGPDLFQADGDGFFDIQVLFEAINGAKTKYGLHKDLVTAEVYSMSISSTDPITVDSFNFPSYQDGGEGTYLTAAKIGGIGIEGDSGWIAIPEPITFLFFALGSLALVQQRRKK